LRGFAVGLESACPRVGWQANLMPVERRTADSRWRWAPTAALLFLLLLLGVGFLVRPWVQDKAYADALRERIEKFETAVAEVRDAKAQAEDARRKLAILRRLGDRTRRDLAILNELSQRVPDSAWLTQLQISDDDIKLNGEAQNAADLLRVLNEAQTVTKARFTTSLRKIEDGESFQIAVDRAAPPAPGTAPAAPATAAPPQPSAEQPPAAPPAAQAAAEGANGE
jgi:general secretion pathway protein L